MADPTKINREALKAEVKSILEPYKESFEGAQADVELFYERATEAITIAILSGDTESASEVAGGLRAMAWGLRVQVSRANALVLRRSVLLLVRTAVGVIAAL